MIVFRLFALLALTAASLHSYAQCEQTLQNITVSSGISDDYEAEKSLYVAGDATSFIIQNNGESRLRAGERIHLKSGFRLEAGGRFHGKITPTGAFAPLTSKRDGSTHQAGGCGLLRFSFQESYTLPDQSTLHYTVYNDKQEALNGLPLPYEVLGYNAFGIDISSLDPDQTYTLEVSDARNRKGYLRFHYTVISGTGDPGFRLRWQAIR